MLVDVENAKSLTYYAAWATDEGLAEAPLAVSMAKAYASDACRKVAGAGIQLHGGIGFTWEHDLQLYFKRAPRPRRSPLATRPGTASASPGCSPLSHVGMRQRTQPAQHAITAEHWAWATRERARSEGD